MAGIRIGMAVLLSLGLIGLAGCSGTDEPAGSTVLVIGDSITAMSRDRIAAALERKGWAPTVEAEGGTDIAFWRRRTAALARTLKPEAVVVELGTNQRGSEQRVARLVDAVMHDLRGVPTVKWLNVQEGKRIGPQAVPPHAAALNRVLDGAQLRWPNLEVLDFNDYFANRPEWHAPDGLHPNEAGQAALARFLVDAL